MRLYLAGPEVFLPNAREIGEAKQRLCAAQGITGLFPLDQDVPDPGSKAAWADAIFRKNLDLMDGADGVIANMTPFRGISMDVGTAFEMGYMHARGKLVLGYTNAAGSYLERAIRAGIERPEAKDELGLSIESFGLADNLMMVCAVRTGGLEVLVAERSSLVGLALYTDLGLFAKCVEIAAAEFRKRG